MAADITPILQSVLSAASSALNEEHRSPARVEMTPGTLPAWDDCCDGQLYLRVIEVYPTAGKNSPFPQIDVSQSGAAGSACSIHALAVHIGLGVIRCAATVDDAGNSPTTVAVTSDAVLMLDDMATLLDVLVCVVPSTIRGIQGMKLDRWIPQGVEGGCHGGEWGAFFAVNPCLCQDQT